MLGANTDGNEKEGVEVATDVSKTVEGGELRKKGGDDSSGNGAEMERGAIPGDDDEGMGTGNEVEDPVGRNGDGEEDAEDGGGNDAEDRVELGSATLADDDKGPGDGVIEALVGADNGREDEDKKTREEVGDGTGWKEVGGGKRLKLEDAIGSPPTSVYLGIIVYGQSFQYE